MFEYEKHVSMHSTLFASIIYRRITIKIPLRMKNNCTVMICITLKSIGKRRENNYSIRCNCLFFYNLNRVLGVCQEKTDSLVKVV